jgi:hypothetical protein
MSVAESWEVPMRVGSTCAEKAEGPQVCKTEQKITKSTNAKSVTKKGTQENLRKAVTFMVSNLFLIRTKIL